MDARTPHRFRIVAAIDRSEYADIVLEHAIDQAARHDPTDLELVTVVGRKEDLQAVHDELATRVIQALELLGPSTADWRSRVHVLAGNASDEITSLAADLDADLIVAGKFGTHDKRQSIVNEIVARAMCPVLIVGLTEHTVDPVAQCPDCVAVRAQSDGERWFCAAHATDVPLRMSSMIPGLSSSGGGPLL